jgi:hypothetical protein
MTTINDKCQVQKLETAREATTYVSPFARRDWHDA